MNTLNKEFNISEENIEEEVNELAFTINELNKVDDLDEKILKETLSRSQFIFDKLTELIGNGAISPGLFSAAAQLSNSITNTFNSSQTMIFNNKQLDFKHKQLELKQKELEFKIKQLENKNPDIQNNFLIVGSREEILKALESPDIIDLPQIEYKDEENE